MSGRRLKHSVAKQAPTALHLSGGQDDSEARTEPYTKYGEGALELAPPQSAKSAGDAASSARRQARALQSSQRPFAVFDIDGTLIRWQLYHAIVDELGKQGHLAPELHQQIRDARMTWKSRDNSSSFSTYERTLIDVYHAALTDLPVAAYQHAVDQVFETYKDQVYTYTRDLINQLKSQDYRLFVISGSQQEVIQKLGDYYGFEAVVGTAYEQTGGRFTGQRTAVAGHKQEILAQLIERYNLPLTGSLAVGDTGSDIAMLAMVEQPIAFNPNQQLFEHARAAGWRVVLERKNMVYQLEPHDGSYLLAKAD